MVFSLLVVLAVLVLYYLVLKFQPVLTANQLDDSSANARVAKGSRDMSAMRASASVKDTQRLGSAQSSGGSGLHNSFTVDETEANAKAAAEFGGDADPVSDVELRTPFTTNLKALVTFVQLSSAAVRVVELQWPSAFATVVGALNFVNFDLIPWSTLACLVTVDYYTKLWVICLTPIVVLLLLSAVFFAVMKLADRCDLRDNDAQRVRRATRKAQFTRLSLFTLFLLYPGLCSRVFSFFACREVGGYHYLLADFSLGCGPSDKRWLKYLPFVISAVLGLALGIPAFFFALVWRNRLKLRSPKTTFAFGFLYEAYTHADWWFEMVDMLQKLLLTSVLMLFGVNWQLRIGMILTTCYLMLQLWRKVCGV